MSNIKMNLKSDEMNEEDIDFRSFILGYMAGIEVGKVYARDRKWRRRFNQYVQVLLGRSMGSVGHE